ncbi:MAG: TM2 domain-containing protein [Bacteroidota bacterium]
MDTQPNAYMMLSGISAEELGFLHQATTGLDENQQRNFFNLYRDKRKNPNDILLFTLLGFTVIGAGIQRFVLGQILMGLLYFFTAGFCFIGTIVDLINNKELTLDYNKKMVYESLQIIKMGGSNFTF